MIKDVTITTAEYICNMVEVIGVILVLFLAFAFQILFHELPCPLCLLQRIGLFGVAFGFLLNFRYGLHPSHYAIVILSALYTAFVALRQIALHVVPGTGSYGDPIFGLHLYTWSFIISILIIIGTTLIMSVDRQYAHEPLRSKGMRIVTHSLFAIVSALLITNIVGVLLECGLQHCPDNPTQYLI